MSQPSKNIAIGALEHPGQVRLALWDLRHEGFQVDDVGVLGGDDRRAIRRALLEVDGADGNGDSCWGLPVTAGSVTSIGPTIAGGVFAGLFDSFSRTPTRPEGSLRGTLLGLGVDGEAAAEVMRQLRCGLTLVLVHARRAQRAARILSRYQGACGLAAQSGVTRGREAAGADSSAASRAG